MSIVLQKFDRFGRPSRSWDGRRTFRDAHDARRYVAQLRRFGDKSTFRLGDKMLAPAPKHEVEPRRAEKRECQQDVTAELVALFNSGVCGLEELARRLGVSHQSIQSRFSAARRKRLVVPGARLTYVPTGQIGEIFRLHQRGKSPNEIAEATGAEPSIVRSRLRYLREQGLVPV